MRNLALTGSGAAAGLDALTTLTLFLFYGLADERGQNPNWRTLGYPGPISPTPEVERPLRPYTPDGDTTLDADVCIVGSGAGGGVMAGVLAERGLNVVVLEAGGYFDLADFNQLEISAYQNLYWRGGPTLTADMNVSLQAGFCLGGGTVVNWTNSLRTTPWVREQWEREYGLEGLAGGDFDRHLDAVWERLSVTDRCSQLNGPQQRMRAGAEKLGWRFKTVQRNTDEGRYSFETAGYMGFGDQTGAKQSTVKTYLQDAYDRGATLVTRCCAQRILTERGRATGVEATWSDPAAGRAATITVRAPHVVVACGALESPALLLRSGIGGPAVGDHLRVHPCTATAGFYSDDLEAWKGAPQAGIVHEFENIEEGHGFLIESPQYTTALAAAALPYTDGASHKRVMSNFRYGASLIALLRDRGHGRVRINRAGKAVPWYSLTDELDLRNAREGIEAQARLHEAAGAQQILGAAVDAPSWCRGADLDTFIADTQRIPLEGPWLEDVLRPPDGNLPNGHRPAHQRRGPLGRAARSQRRVDRGRKRVPHRLRHQSNDHDYGARPPQRAGGCRGRPERRPARPRHSPSNDGTNTRHSSSTIRTRATDAISKSLGSTGLSDRLTSGGSDHGTSRNQRTSGSPAGPAPHACSLSRAEASDRTLEINGGWLVNPLGVEGQCDHAKTGLPLIGQSEHARLSVGADRLLGRRGGVSHREEPPRYESRFRAQNTGPQAPAPRCRTGSNYRTKPPQRQPGGRGHSDPSQPRRKARPEHCRATLASAPAGGGPREPS